MSLSMTGQTLNNIAYGLLSRLLLNLLAMVYKPKLMQPRIESADLIVFAIFNQKKYYN